MEAYIAISLQGSTSSNIKREIQSIIDIIYPAPKLAKFPIPNTIKLVTLASGVELLHTLEFFGTTSITLNFKPHISKTMVELNLRMNSTGWEASFPILSSSTQLPIDDQTLKILTHHQKNLRTWKMNVPTCTIRIWNQDKILNCWPGITNKCQPARPQYPSPESS